MKFKCVRVMTEHAYRTVAVGWNVVGIRTIIHTPTPPGCSCHSTDSRIAKVDCADRSGMPDEYPTAAAHDTIVNGPASFLSSEKNKGLTHIERLEQNARRNGSIRTIQAIQLHDRGGEVVIIFVGIVVNNIEEG